MPSQGTKFIHEQPSALVKNVFGGTQSRKQLIHSRRGKLRSHRNMYAPRKRQTLVIKDMKTNITEAHRERQNVGS